MAPRLLPRLRTDTRRFATSIKNQATCYNFREETWGLAGEISQVRLFLGTSKSSGGHYQFSRLTFEIKCVSEILQKESYEAHGDTSREDIIADYMIIASTDRAQQDTIPRAAMLKSREENS